MKKKYKQIINTFDVKGKELEPIINEFTFEELEKFPQIRSNNKERFIENIYRKNRNREYKYRVSNLGNVEIREDNKNNYESAKIINHKSKGNGWLILEKHPSIYVYHLVAETWLKKLDGNGWHVHHINDNGNDNRPENLIYLKSEVHNKLPKKTI